MRALAKFILVAAISLAPIVSATIIPLSSKPSSEPVEISSSETAFPKTTSAIRLCQTKATEPTTPTLSPQESAFVASFRTHFIQDVAGDRFRKTNYQDHDKGKGEQSGNPNTISWSSKQGKEFLARWHKAWVRSRLKMRIEDQVKAWFDPETEEIGDDETEGLDDTPEPVKAVNATCQVHAKDEDRQDDSRRSEEGNQELDPNVSAVAGSDSKFVPSQDVFYLRSLEDPIYISSLDFLELVARSKVRRGQS